MYDPTRPEPSQRNTVINVGRYLSLLEQQADSQPFRPFGVDRGAVELARNRLAFTESLPGMQWMVRQHQLRSLICDGPRMLAWVGVVDASPFGPREEALLAGVVPALQRSLAFERRLETASLHARGFDAVMEALPSAAFLIDEAGRLQHTNALGRAWHERDPRGLAELLRGRRRGNPTGSPSRRSSAMGSPGTCSRSGNARPRSTARARSRSRRRSG